MTDQKQPDKTYMCGGCLGTTTQAAHLPEPTCDCGMDEGVWLGEPEQVPFAHAFPDTIGDGVPAHMSTDPEINDAAQTALVAATSIMLEKHIHPIEAAVILLHWSAKILADHDETAAGTIIDDAKRLAIVTDPNAPVMTSAIYRKVKAAVVELRKAFDAKTPKVMQ